MSLSHHSLCYLLLLVLTLIATTSEATARCDLNAQACTNALDARSTVQLDITPKPIKTMKKLDITVTVLKDKTPLKDAEVIVDFTMPAMYMGINKVRLKQTPDARYQGTWVLPRCPSGLKTWKAEVIIKAPPSKTKLSTDFLFDVLK